MKKFFVICFILSVILIGGCVSQVSQVNQVSQVSENGRIAQNGGISQSGRKTVDLNVDANVSRLDKVNSWFYYIGFDLDSVLGDIVSSNYDMVVIDPVFTEKQNRNYDIKSVVEKIKNSKGRNVPNKITLAYIDIGQGESFRYYWQPGWKIGNPDFIVGQDPDGWADNYPAAFWKKEWQDIWLDEKNGQLKSLIESGFDGVYLDWIEAYSDENVLEKAGPDGIESKEEMKKFVKKIKDFGLSKNKGFIVISQNAAELSLDDDYVRSIDGISQEQVWFDGRAEGEPQGDCPLPLYDSDIDSAGYVNSLSPGCRQLWRDFPESTLHVSSEGYIKDLLAAKKKGLKIFTVDYAVKSENIRTVYQKSKAFGFVPFASNRALNKFVPSNVISDKQK